MSPHLISVRVGVHPDGTYHKTIAYLLDLQTIRIQDLVTRGCWGVHIVSLLGELAEVRRAGLF